jgi:hypothetical protein
VEVKCFAVSVVSQAENVTGNANEARCVVACSGLINKVVDKPTLDAMRQVQFE